MYNESIVGTHLGPVRGRLVDVVHVSKGIRYGGSAGPGLLTRLGNAVDGLFLGRFGHDPAAFEAVVCESAPQDDQPVDLHEGAVR